MSPPGDLKYELFNAVGFYNINLPVTHDFIKS